jgi:amino acid adenylation domain-containing protein
VQGEERSVLKSVGGGAVVAIIEGRRCPTIAIGGSSRPAALNIQFAPQSFGTPGIGLLTMPEFKADQGRLSTRSGLEGKATSLPRSRMVPRLFETEVRRRPDVIAVSFENQQLTYGELNALANQLARLLLKQGVGPGVLVGLCMERSLRMVVSLLAILKAGGAYVPLDPAYPRARLASIVEDSHARLLLTGPRTSHLFPDVDSIVLCLDPDGSAFCEESDEDLPVKVGALDPAYMIFTSGSTGRPKGVRIPHRALVNILTSMREILGFTERDAMLGITTLSFDIAALEIFMPLITGARLRLVDREVAMDGTRLIEALSEPGITFLQATPATWRLLLEAGWQGKAELHMLCGGEALPRELANRLIGRGAALWNLYGPSETTIWSCAGKVEMGDGPVPIGRPVANTQIYILDDQLQRVPVGVPGELYIGGTGLADGYVNRPELTALSFVPDPFAGNGGGRLYRTGDLALYRSDGAIEFLGRIDQQVKISGFRIEVEEIEAVLREHAAVRDCVVTAQEDRLGEKRLVAYIVPGDRRRTPAASESTSGDTAEQLSIWRQVWDSEFQESADDPTFNIAGWKSSYTGETLPAEEVLESVEHTAARLLPICRDKVLEIGCGSGLLLWRIAPHCTAYVGTDFSTKAVDGLRRALGSSGRSVGQVTLLEREADDFSGFEAGQFDTVILNSVVQYFPNVAYLVRVFENALRVLRPGGTGADRVAERLRCYAASGSCVGILLRI